MKKINCLSLIVLSILIIKCAPKEQRITKEEAIDFAKRIERSLKEGSSKIYDSLFNVRVFANKVANESGNKLNSGYYKGVADALKKNDLGKMILSQMSEGSYDFLRQYEKNNRRHIVFRFQGQGINYHDYELVKFDNGIKVADLYDFVSAQNFTKSIANIMVAIDGYSEGNDMGTQKSLKRMTEIKKLMKQKEYAQAKEEYDALPEVYKKERIFQAINLQIAFELGEETYMAALNEFENLFGNDPTAQLSLIDAYIYRKQYDKVLISFNKIDSAVGGDPFLNYYRALICSQKGEQNKAIQYLVSLHKDFPDFSDGHIELIAQYLSAKNYDKAKELIAFYKTNKKLDQSKLINIKILYPEFTAQYSF